MRLQRPGILTAFLLLSLTVAVAQEFRGRVQGLVTDAAGAVAPGATLTLRNLATNVESTRTSNEQGRYIFDYVDPGTYSLSAELAGFRKSIQQNIPVQQRGDVTVDLKLEMGAVSESITVAAAPVSLELNTATRDLTIETKMVQDLPSGTRNPFQ